MFGAQLHEHVPCRGDTVHRVEAGQKAQGRVLGDRTCQNPGIHL